MIDLAEKVLAANAKKRTQATGGVANGSERRGDEECSTKNGGPYGRGCMKMRYLGAMCIISSKTGILFHQRKTIA